MRRSLCYLLPFSAHIAAAAVSLSEFSPYSTNLSPSCEAVYTTPISGCTVNDFSGGGSCSQQCLDGLVGISTQIYRKCRQTQDYQLLIAQFLNGNGITTLCHGVAVVTVNAPPTHVPTSTHYRQHPNRPHGTSTASGHPHHTASRKHGHDGTTRKNPAHPHPTGSRKHCDATGGDPFSSCPDTFSHNAASESLKGFAMMSLVTFSGGMLVLFLLLA